MAYRSASLRHNVVNENSIHLKKEVTKLETGPILKRAALDEIGNKAANVQRSFSTVETVKSKLNSQVFKKPVLAKAPVLKKNVAKRTAVEECRKTAPAVVEEESESVCESTMRTIVETPDAAVDEKEKTVSSPEDMSVLEGTTTQQTDQSVDDLSIAFSSKMLNITDIDAEDRDNPQLVSEYAEDIYVYMRSLEDKHLVKRRYLDGHSVTPRMRTILVDWLVQVHMRFNLMQETLYLTFAILDRYLQLMPDTKKEELQLVGVTAMFIASKYEETYCSEIHDFVYISDRAYTKSQIRQMERKILKKLDFYISYPLPLHFLRRNSKAAQVDGTQHTLAKYLMELCQPDYNMCQYKASEIGAAALCLSMRLIGDQTEWTDTLTYYSNYTEAHLTPILCRMAQCITRSHNSTQQSIPKKYEASKYMKISTIPELRSPLIRSLAQKAASLS
uniref:G2/mitotic-specific cyclin-B-like n=1 Tax=Hirondellea gigas TaxID=1518452 RepID=A0A2P2I3H3_9CRUS